MILSASSRNLASRAVQKGGVSVTFQRLGPAPSRAVAAAASVTALVNSAQPDTADAARLGIASSALGSLTQSQRKVIVMAADLTAAAFPLPVKKNDRIVIAVDGQPSDPVILVVNSVDPFRLAMAGAIEITAAGIA